MVCSVCPADSPLAIINKLDSRIRVRPGGGLPQASKNLNLQGTEQAGGSKTDSTTKSAAVAATKNTEGALESAKQAFSGPN